jgi:hypothetical protein
MYNAIAEHRGGLMRHFGNFVLEKDAKEHSYQAAFNCHSVPMMRQLSRRP